MNPAKFARLRLHLLVLSGLSMGSLYSCASHSTNEASPAKSPTIVKKTAESNALYTPNKSAEPAKPVFVKPKNVRGIYLTAWSAGSRTKMKKVYALLKRTELNSVVIDIRDSGQMYFPTKIPLADSTVGKNYLAVPKPEALMQELAKNEVWPIARIACFRDNYVPAKHPELAVQVANGKPWQDRSRHMWLDPYNKKNWDYLAQTVEYALDLGFPEIQLDYVRFPSEGKSSTQIFPSKGKYPDQKAQPADVIAAFAKYIGDKVKARNAVYSADIFGIISSGKSDQGIGQTLEKIAAPFDVVSPMVYPSHYAKGEYGIADPNKAPYAILMKSLADYRKRIPNHSMRPWLQDFSLGVKYDASMVKAQIKACYELGYQDWLLWNAGNVYTEGALVKEPTQKSPAIAPSVKKI